jgi:RNA polymerase sigma-70 factor (ECF subfamily)
MTTHVETLWADFAGRLRAFIRGRVRDHADAEDILQETFLKIHRNLPALRADQKVEAWIWRIARNAIADHFRRSRRDEPLAGEVEAPAEAPTDAPDLACCLRGFVDQLAPAHREALLLTDWQGLSQIDLARRLGLSASGAKSRVQRARAGLKGLLDACCRFELDRRGNIIEMTPRKRECAASSSR